MLRASDTIAQTDTGRQRRDNEDSAYARAPVFVVADGMGGAQAGEVAKKGAAQAQDALQGLVQDLRLRRKADALAKQLGYLIAHEPKGKSSIKDEIDELAGEIRTLEDRIAQSGPGPSDPGQGAAQTGH